MKLPTRIGTQVVGHALRLVDGHGNDLALPLGDCRELGLEEFAAELVRRYNAFSMRAAGGYTIKRDDVFEDESDPAPSHTSRFILDARGRTVAEVEWPAAARRLVELANRPSAKAGAR